jgi:hypothetical protein
MRISLGVAVAGVLALVIGDAAAVSAQQQVFDHLKCYKVKELSKRKVKGLVDLIPQQTQFLREADCKLAGPKLLCVPVSKVNPRTDPPPVAGTPPGPVETDHICYALKCRKPFPGAVTVSDQFGTFTLQPTGTSLLCTPASKEGQTTTTTTSTTTTSTTLPQNPCRNLAGPLDAPMCSGDCPTADLKCLFVPTTNECDCVPLDQMCNSTSTGVCNGLCPNAGEMCTLGALDSCECLLPCESTAPTCGGFCPPASVCVPGPTGCECSPIL